MSYAGLYFIAGMLIGCIATSIITVITLRSRTSGTIVLDYSESNEKPLLYMELTQDMDELLKKKSAKFEIKSKR